MSANIRIQRTNSDILKIVTTTIQQKLGNAALQNVTVQKVETSADFAHAKVFVDVAGTEEDKQRAMAELERSAGFIRNEIAQRVKLRQTPRLRFMLDRGRENADRVEEVLAQLNAGKKD